MLNKDKINKIKGILSAGNGTLISYFEPGGAFLTWELYHAKYPDRNLLQYKENPYEDPIDQIDPYSSPVFREGQNQFSFYEGLLSVTLMAAKLEQTEKEQKKVEELTTPKVPGDTNSTPTDSQSKVNNIVSEEKLKIKPATELDEVEVIAKSEAQDAALSGLGKGIDAAEELLVDKKDFASDDPTLGKWRNRYDAVANSLTAFGPVGTTVGVAMKAVGLANDMLGSKTDIFNIDEKLKALIGGSYEGSYDAMTKAQKKAGKNYGLAAFNAKNKANKAIANAKDTQARISTIADEAADRRASVNAFDQNYLAYMRRTDGGYDQRYMSAAKNGAKIEYFKKPFRLKIKESKEFFTNLTETPPSFKYGGNLDLEDDFEIVISEPIDLYKSGGILTIEDDLWEPIITEDISILKEGGSIKEPEIEVIETNTTQKSVIPEGALHKNKHHLDEVGVDDSELTKKGIPVVDINGEQLAEIELNEIIFTLEVTRELEKRYKEFYDEETSKLRKEEAALEAGKLLWKEIIYNTDDRTGLINTLKLGGVLKVLQGTEVPDALAVKKPENMPSIPIKKEKPYYRIWLKDVNPNFRSPNYDLETAYRILPFETLERWKMAVNSDNPKYYMDFKDAFGLYPYHLPSVAPLGEDFIFLKLGNEESNPELHWETDNYYNGKNGLNKTHDLVYDEKLGRYFYRKKKKATKHDAGGTLSIEDSLRNALYTPVTTSYVSSNSTLPTLFEAIPEIVLTTQLQSASLFSRIQSSPIWETNNPGLISPTTRLPIPTNINLQGWDLHKTLAHLRALAKDKSTHYCARSVREALEAGGLVGFRVPNAKDEVQLHTLETIGFQKIADAVDDKVNNGYIPQAGDVAISYENGNHVAMYDGTRWISDFNLTGLDVYKNKKNTKSAIYRRILPVAISISKNGGSFNKLREFSKTYNI